MYSPVPTRSSNETARVHRRAHQRGGVPLAARGQQTKVWRVGFLSPAFPPLKNPGDAAVFDAFRQEMSHLGYVEGKNLIIEGRWTEGQIDRLPAFANELVSLPCDAIVANGTAAIAVAQRATSTIPIVMCPTTDPVRFGFVKSLAHPGGNITGIANLSGDMTAKSIELLHTILPDAKKIAVLMSPNPIHPSLYEVTRVAAQSFGLHRSCTCPNTGRSRTRISKYC
jgi:putative tryptophan/tyrosine transport system substrate-binding protein